jgi:hypothetical protein
MRRDEGKRFRQYLAGLIIAAAPLTPAIAGPPPTPTVSAKVSFAQNLKEKLKTATPRSPKLAAGKYSQKFGDLYVQESPWLELGPFWLLLPGNPAVAESTPPLSASEAFALIKKA